MATFIVGFISDLSAIKDNITLRVRIVRTWMQALYNQPQIKNMEMILMDEQNNKLQASVRMKLVNKFKHQLEEGSAVTLQCYSLGEIQPKFRIVNNRMRLSFLSNTVVEKCTDFKGSVHGFDFRPFNTITGLRVEEDGQFDVIGQVVACDDLDNYDKNGKAGKKKPLTLIDVEGNELRCTLWGVFAEQFCDFLNACNDHGKIILVLQLAMMKFWDGKMCVQNGYNGSKLFLHNGKESVINDDLNDIEEFRKSLVSKEGNENSENTISRISTASKHSTKDDFVKKFPFRTIAELLDVEQGMASIIVGTIIAIHEEEGWWYIGCRTCRKKVIKEIEIVDLETDMENKSKIGPDEWRCTKCNVVTTSIKTIFRLQVRVQDDSGTISLTLFNDEVQSLVGRSAYQLCDKYGKAAADESFPTEILALIGKRFAFKVAIDEFNAKKLLPVFNVLRFSGDPDIIDSLIVSATPNKAAADESFPTKILALIDIIDSLIVSATPNKPENEATSAKLLAITPLSRLKKMIERVEEVKLLEKS
ncbi:replication protein A 70 kDa DNA-binding subunit B [Tanacetum coccineum]|uniref:Replication protein A 70 kDa DNA-binding subunit B n=1 Tax=Tanacetum coccineum TaxID=301880 RepID=A0ABQ5DRM8_9ASTR